jgi:hypothetical protein
MAEVIPKNHKFFLFFNFLKNIRQVVKYRQIKISASSNWKPTKSLIINVILKNGGSNP